MDLMLIDLLESSKAIGLCPMGIWVICINIFESNQSSKFR